MQRLPLRFFECCAPTLEESVEELIEKGAPHITVATTMFTPGGSHLEIEIAEILEQPRTQYPDIAIQILRSATLGHATWILSQPCS